MASVTLENVSKTYNSREGAVHAVDDVDLEVRDGEFVVLVGPSGSGKSTVLRLIAGLERVSSGVIRIDGRDVTGAAPKDRDIAMVFQNYALYPHMTVFQNMAFGLKMRRVPKSEIEKKVNGVADMLGLARLLRRKPAALSGGECQRVAVGRAIVRNPKVFLFDEPLSNLDAKLRGQMRTELKSLQQKLRATIVYVTHDQEEAMTLGQTLVIMNEGRIQQKGAPLELYSFPANRFVAEFIGTPTINILDGHLRRDGQATAFENAHVRFVFPTEVDRNLWAHDARPVSIGIRPEHLTLCRKAAPADEKTTHPIMFVELECRVHVREPLGECVLVYLVGPGESAFVSRISSADEFAIGEEVRLRIDLAHLHVFAGDDAGTRLN